MSIIYRFGKRLVRKKNWEIFEIQAHTCAILISSVVIYSFMHFKNNTHFEIIIIKRVYTYMKNELMKIKWNKKKIKKKLYVHQQKEINSRKTIACLMNNSNFEFYNFIVQKRTIFIPVFVFSHFEWTILHEIWKYKKLFFSLFRFVHVVWL